MIKGKLENSSLFEAFYIILHSFSFLVSYFFWLFHNYISFLDLLSFLIIFLAGWWKTCSMFEDMIKNKQKKNMLLLMMHYKRIIHIQEENTEKLLHAYNNTNFQEKYFIPSFCLVLYLYKHQIKCIWYYQRKKKDRNRFQVSEWQWQAQQEKWLDQFFFINLIIQ